MKKTNKTILIVLAMVLVCVMSVAGTLAYLTKTTDAVTNTFTATTGLTDEFKLDEAKVELKDGAYVKVSPEERVIKNDYKALVPNQVLPKDPTITADIKDDVKAYIYVEVLDTSNEMLTYTVTDKWTLLSGVTPKTANAKVYALAAGPVLGAKNGTVAEVVETILVDNEVTVSSSLEIPSTVTGDEYEFGTLKFYGYAVQAEGFTDAKAAWDATFGADE